MTSNKLGISKFLVDNPQMILLLNNFWKDTWPNYPKTMFVYAVDMGKLMDMSMTLTAAEFTDEAYENTNFTERYKIPDSDITRVISKALVFGDSYFEEIINTPEREDDDNEYAN